MKQLRVAPTVLFLITFALGFILLWIHPWQLTLYIKSQLVQVIGITLLLTSLILNTLAYRAFKKAFTPHAPFEEAKVLITNSVFSLSRNPVYLALVLSQCGMAFVFDSVWIVISSLLLIILLQFLVIKEEENMLQELFEKSYEAYKQKTRRWI